MIYPVNRVIHLSYNPVWPSSQRVVNAMKIWILFSLIFINITKSHGNWQYGFPLASSIVLFYNLLTCLIFYSNLVKMLNYYNITFNSNHDNLDDTKARITT